MKTTIFTIALCSVMLFGVSCSKENLSDDDSTQSGLQTDISVVDFNVPVGCVGSYSNIQRDSVYVINSEEEWAKIYTCESDPNIDFSTKTLLVAWGTVTNGIVDVSTKLTFANNIYTLTVDIPLGIIAVVEDWGIVLITDKINTQSVMLSVNASQTVTDDIIPFDEYHLEPGASCQWTEHEIEERLVGKGEVVVINSDEELKQYVICTGDDYPAVDFSKYTMLLAHGVGTSSVVSADCIGCWKLSEQDYRMYVGVVLGDAGVLSYWQVPIIIDKLSEGCSVVLKTYYH